MSRFGFERVLHRSACNSKISVFSIVPPFLFVNSYIRYLISTIAIYYPLSIFIFLIAVRE